MSNPASATSSSTTESPFQTRIPNAKALAVDLTGRNRISLPLSPTSERLSSAEPTRDPLLERYQEARQLIETDSEKSRGLFAELIVDLPKIEANLLFFADCKLGFALTYFEDDEKRTNSARDAKQDLDQVYKNKSAWDSLDGEERINRYKQLRASLREFENLTQNDMASLEDIVESQIEECNRNIPLLSDFYDRIREGVRLKGNGSSKIFTQALQMIEGRENPEYLLARAFGTVNLALIYGLADDSNPHSLKACTQAFLAYQHKEALFTNDKEKLNALNLFSELFNKLSQVISASSAFQLQIKKALVECKEELARLEGPVLKNSGTSSTKGPKVSKEPVDSWKTARIFIAFGFATIVIASAFVLGRRYTQLS